MRSPAGTTKVNADGAVWGGRRCAESAGCHLSGAGAVIYVFSTVDRASFDDLPKWKRKVEEECGRICSVLVQNKIDLEDEAAMARDEVEDMADRLNMRLYRSCVQDNVNVGEGLWIQRLLWLFATSCPS
jgi:hypothetical protein